MIDSAWLNSLIFGSRQYLGKRHTTIKTLQQAREAWTRTRLFFWKGPVLLLLATHETLQKTLPDFLAPLATAGESCLFFNIEFFGQTVWWIEHSPFFSAGTSCRLVAIKSHEIRSIYMSPAILLSPWLYVITYIFNKIRYELTARNRIEQLLIKKPSLRPNGHLD
jgi:hypothetical protein